MARVFSSTQRVTLYAICEALFASEAGPPPKARLDWLVGDAENFLAEAGPRATRSIKLLISLVAWLAPWFALRAAPIRSMPLELRIRVLDRMERGFAGALIVGLKAALCILYYEDADAEAEIGFDGGCLVGPTTAANAVR